MNRFALILLSASACSNGPITTSDARTQPQPSQYDPARYGTRIYRFASIRDWTARQIEVVEGAMFDAQSIGPAFVHDPFRTVDFVIERVDPTGTSCEIRWNAMGFQIWGCNSDAKLANAVLHGVVRWLGNQQVCTSTSQMFRSTCDHICSPVGYGPAVSNSSCLSVSTGFDDVAQFSTDYIGPLTQLDLDEFRRNHP